MEIQMNGIDISQYQGVIDWKKVAEDDVDFAFIRSTICLSGYKANGYQDWRFQSNWENARKNASIALGVYHVFTAHVDATVQLEAIDKSLVGKLPDMPIAIDVERRDVIDKVRNTELLVNFLTAVETNFGKPIIYTGAWYWNVNIVVGDWSRYPLWTAAYTQEPIIPKGWTEWMFWQYTSSGIVDGVSGNVDKNYGKFAFDDFEEIDVEMTDLAVIRNGLGVDSLQSGTLEPGARLKVKKMWVEVAPGQWSKLDGNFKTV